MLNVKTHIFYMYAYLTACGHISLHRYRYRNVYIYVKDHFSAAKSKRDAFWQ